MVLLYAQNISDDHPAVEMLRDLENTTYRVDNNSSGYILRLAHSIIHVILRWADMLNCNLKVVLPYVL
jgi:Ser/Thr protein kinase RdoA (MazF antagonist)